MTLAAFAPERLATPQTVAFGAVRKLNASRNGALARMNDRNSALGYQSPTEFLRTRAGTLELWVTNARACVRGNAMTTQRYQSASGAVLRAARVLASMTQADLAKAANLYPKSIAYWEKKGSQGRYAEVGTRRVLDALRAHGVEVAGGDGEGVRRISALAV